MTILLLNPGDFPTLLIKLMNFYIQTDVAEAKQTISNRQELAERLSSLESEYQAKVEMIERKDANVLKLKVNYLKGNFI